MSAFVLRASAASADAYIEKNLSGQAEVWLSFDLAFHADALTYWNSNGGFTSSGDFADLESSTPGTQLAGAYVHSITSVLNWDDDASYTTAQSPSPNPSPIAETWQHCELHYTNAGGGQADFYINGVLSWSDQGATPLDSVFKIRIGQYQSTFDAAAIAFFRDIKAGSTRGGSDIFADDFSSDDFSAWDNVVGDVSLVSDSFGEFSPSHAGTRGLYTQTGNFSFDATLSFGNVTGRSEFGLSGDTSTMGFSFISGKIFDWNQSFVGIYNRISQTTISGIVGTSTADYYINDEPIAFGISRPTGHFNHIYTGDLNQKMNLNLVVQGDAPTYTIQPSSVFSTGDALVPVDIVNYSNFPFEIFSGSANSSRFSLYPTGFVTNTGTLNFRPSGIFSAGLNQVPFTLYTDFGIINSSVTMSGKVDPFSGLFMEVIGSPTITENTTNQYFVQFANSGIPISIVPYLEYVSGSGIQLLNIPISGIYDVMATGLITYSGDVSGHVHITGSGYALSSVVSGVIDSDVFSFQWATGVQLSPISFVSTGLGTGLHYSGVATGIINDIASGYILDGSGFYHVTWNNIQDNILRIGTGASVMPSGSGISGVSAWVDKSLGSGYTGIWLSCEVAFNSNVLSFWDAGNISPNFFSVLQNDTELAGLDYTTGSWHNPLGSNPNIYGLENPPANKWFNLEMYYHSGIVDFYVDNQFLFTDGGLNTLRVNKVRFGSSSLPAETPPPPPPGNTLYISFRVNEHDSSDCSDFIHLSLGGVYTNFIAVYADPIDGWFTFYGSSIGAGSSNAGTFALDTWATIEMRLVFTGTDIDITPRVDGTEFASFTVNGGFTSIDAIQLGGINGCGLNNHNLDDLTVGTTDWGASDLFAVDFNDFSIVPPFDSTTGAGLDASDGTLFCGDNADAYAEKALIYP